MFYGHIADVVVLIALPIALLVSSGHEAESLSVGHDAAMAVDSAAAAVGGFFAATPADYAASSSAAADFVSHAFVQTGSELHYFRDVSHQDVLLSSISELADRQSRKMDAKKAPKGVSIFDNEATHFGALSVGVPVSKHVFVVNPTSARIVFNAITSPAVSVHCSFVASKVLEPQQRTNFTVILLPSHETSIEDFILVHTSIGKFSHKVIGNVASNPYRLRSLFGVKLPLNATHVSALTLHNPHAALMTITQIFSNDANLQVELSENPLLRSGAASKWELAPFETRDVGKLHVLGNIESNSTSFVYVRFRLRHCSLMDECASALLDDKNESSESAVVIPVEVQVTSRRNIFSTEHVFDFGLIRHGERSGPLTFYVYSNIEKGVDIESIYAPARISGGSADSVGARRQDVYVQFASRPPLSVKCGASGQPGVAVPIAKLTLSSTLSPGDVRINDKLFRKRGTIVAESRGGNYNVTVPYEALIYKGELTYDANLLAFHCQEPPPAVHNILLTNNFSVPLAIWNVSISKTAQHIFEARLITPIVVLQPGQSLPALLLKYVRAYKSNVFTELTLYTNLSDFRLPLFLFRGRLNVRLRSHASSSGQRVVDFGELLAGEHRSVLLCIENPNPVSVRVEITRRPWPAFTQVHIHGCSNNTTCHIESDAFELPANGESTLNVTLYASPRSALFDARHPLFRNVNHDARLVLRTRFENLTFRATFRASTSGAIVGANVIEFSDGFVGTVTSKPVKIYSSYDEDLLISRIYLLGDDPGLSIARTPNASDTIKAGSVSTLARVTFAPEASCALNANSNECYVGISLDSADGQWFTYGLKLPQNLAEIDSYLYGRLRRRWAALALKTVNATVVVDTPRVKNFEIPVKATLKWPRLLSHSVVRFPLTAVGNFTIVNLTLSNPSQRPIAVQLLPLVIYPDAESVLDYFRGEFPAPLIEPVEMNETLMFSLRDTELFTLRSGSPVPKLREELEEVVGTSIPRFTLSMLLRPGMRVRIRLGFLPSDYLLRSSLLLIRNNLTGIEPVVLYGQGAQIRMEIENRTARSGAPLLFDIQPAHLADCRNPRRLLHKLASTLTVKRSFIVRNTGEVPFSVVNISINNQPCENRGYRILNCALFRLAPNQSTVLEIAYTPDFLMTQNDASLQLYMHMNGTPWTFEMCAQIPRHMLATCHAALPRPVFESIMYYTCVFALLFCLVCVLACSYLEGDRTVSCAIRQLYLGSGERRVFDLNAAGPAATGAAIAGDDEKNATPFLKSIFNWLKFRRVMPKPQRNRVYLRASSDSSRLTRLCRRVANHVLWFFSHFWLFLRGDDGGDRNNSSNTNSHETSFRDSDIYDAITTTASSSRDVSLSVDDENLKRNNALATKASPRSRHKKTAKVESIEPKTEHKSTSTQSLMNETEESSSERKTQLVRNDNSASRNELRYRKKTVTDHDDVMTREATASATLLPAIGNGTNSSGSFSDLPSKSNARAKQKKRAKKPPDTRLTRSADDSANGAQREDRKPENERLTHLQNVRKETLVAKNDDLPFDMECTRPVPVEPLVIDSLGPPLGFENARPTPSPNGSTSTASSSSSSSVSFVKLDADELRQTSSPLSDAADEPPRLSHTSPDNRLVEFFRSASPVNSDSNDVETFGQDELLAADKSVPEWADSEPSRNIDVNEAFSALALNTAALRFEDATSVRTTTTDGEFSPSPPLSRASRSPSHSGVGASTTYHFQRTPRRPNGYRKEDSGSRSRKSHSAVEDPEIARYIGRMTREYRERLKRAIASGMNLDDSMFASPPKLRLPDDLTSNCSSSGAHLPSIWPPTSPRSAFDEAANLPFGFSGLSPPSLMLNRGPNVGVIGDGVAANRAPTTSLALDADPLLAFTRSGAAASIWGAESTITSAPSSSAATSCGQPASESVHAALLSRGTEHFLFAESDPIWKPIFEEQSSTGFWSTDFNFGTNNYANVDNNNSFNNSNNKNDSFIGENSNNFAKKTKNE